MRKSFYATLILYFLTFTLFGQVLDRELESFLADKESFFLVKLDQNSQEIDIVDHSAYLSAGPFTLVLIYKEPIGVLVNFSLEPTLYNGFKEGKEMGEIVPNPDLFMGLAENDFNLEDRIFIHPIAPHYLYYQDGNAHRFSQISNQAGYIECRRKVSVFSLCWGRMFRPRPSVHCLGNLCTWFSSTAGGGRTGSASSSSGTI